MTEIYLIHYCHPKCIPLYSITELPQEEAFKLAETFGKNSETAFGRFKHFYDYYPNRIKTEEYLYNWFIENKGEPKTKHPLYFVIGGSEYLFNWFDKGIIIKLPLSIIKERHISFTIGDSCAKFRKDNFLNPILKNDLYKIINEQNGDIDIILRRHDTKYIECQLWNNKYLENILK